MIFKISSVNRHGVLIKESSRISSSALEELLSEVIERLSIRGEETA